MAEREWIPTNPEGTLFGFPGPFFLLLGLVLTATIVMVSVWAIGDLDFS